MWSESRSSLLFWSIQARNSSNWNKRINSMHTHVLHRNNCLVQLESGPCHNVAKSECCFLRVGLAQREMNCHLGSLIEQIGNGQLYQCREKRVSSGTGRLHRSAVNELVSNPDCTTTNQRAPQIVSSQTYSVPILLPKVSRMKGLFSQDPRIRRVHQAPTTSLQKLH